jgi:integrase
MSRPKRDGTAARAPNKKKLTEMSVRTAKPGNVWDTLARGLVLRVQPSGHKSFAFVYNFRGRSRWFNLGPIGLAAARARVDKELRPAVADGKDPAAEKMAQRSSGSFGELADRYITDYASRETKTWRVGRRIVEKYLFKPWGRLDARSISRSDVRALKAKLAATPVMANRVLATASAIFNWAISEDLYGGDNPCRGVKLFEESARERVLSDSELPLFWEAFDSAGLVKSSALKVALLCGQRIGEVAHMRREHIVDGRWTMPGAPDAATQWPGTKNGASHRVWLTEVVRDIIAELDGTRAEPSNSASTGFVFASARSGPVTGLADAMKAVVKQIGAERATPHDLRRTFSTCVTRLGFGRDAMNRVTNHKEGGIADVYDRHRYEEENRRVMESVAAHMLGLIEGRPAANVVPLRQA